MGWRVRVEDGASLVLRTFNKVHEDVRHRALSNFATQVADELKNRIDGQEFNFAPLKPRTVELKRKKGLDSRTLIATHGYVDSIYGVANGDHVEVGTSGRDPGTRKDYAEIAKHLEYGTRTMLPRPHWGPTMTWAEERLKRMMVEVVRMAMDVANRKKR